VIGVLELLNKRGVGDDVGFSAEDESLLESAASQFAAALLQRNSELVATQQQTSKPTSKKGIRRQHAMHFTPLYELRAPFSVLIRQVRLPANSMVKDNAKICVTIDLYHAGEKLCEQLRTDKVRARTLSRQQQQQLAQWQAQWQAQQMAQAMGQTETARVSAGSAGSEIGGYSHIGTPGGGSMHGYGASPEGGGADKVVVADFTGALAMASLGGKHTSSAAQAGCTRGARLEVTINRLHSYTRHTP
jgi:hypothetical protein